MGRVGRPGSRTVTVADPLIVPVLAPILAVPFASPMTSPDGVTCATDVSLLVHVRGGAPVIGVPLESRTVAVRRHVAPASVKVKVSGAIVTDAATGPMC